MPTIKTADGQTIQLPYNNQEGAMGQQGGPGLPPPPSPRPEQPAQPGRPASPAQAADPVQQIEQLEQGKTGDNTKPLLGAIRELHSYIAGETDPQMIQMIRGIISMLGNILNNDQERAAQSLAEGGVPIEPTAGGPTG